MYRLLNIPVVLLLVLVFLLCGLMSVLFHLMGFMLACGIRLLNVLEDRMKANTKKSRAKLLA